MINPKNKLFRWGPIDGLPLYPDYWYRGFKNFYQDFAPGWPEVLSYSYDEKFIIIVDYKELYDTGEIVFGKYLFNETKFKLNYQRWQKLILQLKKFMQKIENEKLTKDNVGDLFLAWNKLYGGGFWNIGSLPEVANWGGEQMLEKEIRKKIKNDNDFNLVFERLTAPEDYSFYQLEELDLLKLKKFSGEELEQGLIKHQKKYFWLLNSYHGTRVLPVSYFRRCLVKETPISAQLKIREKKAHLISATQSKEAIVRKYKLSAKVLKISRRLAFSIWWQDIRKSYIFQANHVIHIFLKEMAKLYKINYSDLHYYMVDDLEALILLGRKLSQTEISLRKKNFLAVWDIQGAIYLSGQSAANTFKQYEEKQVNQKISEFKGLVVNRGRVIGRARIIHSPKEAGKMKKGDILVASMTSPDYIVALKKAAAVITDVGGMTCHAAIVSRELKIPGIVATKIATKFLKDGDLVEVNADKGEVRLLKRYIA